MGDGDIIVTNCSFNAFFKLSLEPFLEITCGIINRLHGLCDPHGCIVRLTCAQGHTSSSSSLKPQTKPLQFIFSCNLAEEADMGRLQVC